MSNKPTKQQIYYNPKLFNGGLDFSPDSIRKTDAMYQLKNMPQELNVLSIKAPLKLWPRLIWAKLRGKR